MMRHPEIEALTQRVQRLEVIVAPIMPEMLGRPQAGSMRLLVECAARRLGVSVAEFMGPARVMPLAAVRQACFGMLRRHEGRSLAQIGRYFGGRDHTTVMHGIKAHQERMQRQPEFAALCAAIEADWLNKLKENHHG